MTTTVLTDVRVFDGEGLGESSTVLIVNGRIAAVQPGTASPDDVPDDALSVSGDGGVLLPGLIDAHLHITARKDLDALAANGVTTGFDMASWPESLTTSMREQEHTASIVSAGIPFIGPAGPHSHFGMPDSAIVTDPAQVAAGVQHRIAAGSDYIKVVTEDPGQGGPEPQIVAAVVQAAHAAGKKVVAHASHLGAFKMSFEAGADVITHVPTEAVIDADLAQRMVQQGRVAIPTLSVSKVLMNARPAPGASYQNARDSVAALLAAGVPVLAGTDSVAQAGLPFSIPLGETLHGELELLVEAGMTPTAALRAATVEPAERFGLDDRGAIRPGLRADLLLVGADPTTDISATRDVRGVWIAGERIR